MVLTVVGWLGSAGAVRAVAASAPRAECASADPVAVRRALGVTRAVYVAGPSVQGGVCSWHGIQPNCFVRSLSVAQVGEAVEARRLDVADDEAKPINRAFDLGEHAFFRLEELPPGAAVMISHLYVKRDGRWVRYTLTGRLGPDGSRDLLQAVAAQRA